MDHILEHDTETVPDFSAVSSSGSAAGVTSGAGAPMDEDDEDAEALKSLGVVASDAVEAKVCLFVVSFRFVIESLTLERVCFRVSSVQNVVRYSGILPWQTSTRRRAATTSLRSRQKRSYPFDIFITLLRRLTTAILVCPSR